MKICQASAKCKVDYCVHRRPHHECNDTNIERQNICSAPCDVSGGVMGSVCEDRKMKGIRFVYFRCVFCGQEFETVEECNACEESH